MRKQNKRGLPRAIGGIATPKKPLVVGYYQNVQAPKRQARTRQ